MGSAFATQKKKDQISLINPDAEPIPDYSDMDIKHIEIPDHINTHPNELGVYSRTYPQTLRGKVVLLATDNPFPWNQLNSGISTLKIDISCTLSALSKHAYRKYQSPGYELTIVRTMDAAKTSMALENSMYSWDLTMKDQYLYFDFMGNSVRVCRLDAPLPPMAIGPIEFEATIMFATDYPHSIIDIATICRGNKLNNAGQLMRKTIGSVKHKFYPPRDVRKLFQHGQPKMYQGVAVNSLQTVVTWTDAPVPR
jgi:hypothetical protein